MPRYRSQTCGLLTSFLLLAGLGYFGGRCFDLLAKILRRKFAVSSIRVRKFCQDTYFASSKVFKDGFRRTGQFGEGLEAYD